MRNQPVDLYVCDRCKYVLAEEDWHLPLDPPEPGSCRNCGGIRRKGRCARCGLTAMEDAEVHQELRALIDQDTDYLVAASVASDAGRKLLALKLATAACHEGHDQDVGRLFRLSLLQDLGELAAALSDCKHWIRGGGAESAVAWAVYGEMLLNNLRQGEATEAFRTALRLDPEDHLTRARLSRHLYAMGRYAQAREGAQSVLQQIPDGEPATIARDVMSEYALHLMRRGDLVAVRDVLGAAGAAHIELSARMLALEAWLLWEDGRLDPAKQRLREAHRVDPDDPLVGELKGPLGVKRWSWWTWN
ncbi:MAG TPA: hypothetical protein QGF58_12490 [Myxococcota bacterium]|nr:hypothetical protein [Myxococcota bacterium]